MRKIRYVIEVEVRWDERLDDEMYVEALVDGGLSNKNLLSEANGIMLIDGIAAKVIDKNIKKIIK